MLSRYVRFVMWLLSCAPGSRQGRGSARHSERRPLLPTNHLCGHQLTALASPHKNSPVIHRAASRHP